MDATEKGQRYAQVFRKAGTFLAKGNIARAIDALKEGRALARAWGDAAMAKRFADEIARASSRRGSDE